MSSPSESTYTNAGIYRQCIEDIMYTPTRVVPKKPFHDETLTSLKKVTTLLQKFENGGLHEETVDEDMGTEKEEKVEESQKLGNDDVEGAASRTLYTPTPKPRTIKTPLRQITQLPPDDVAKESSPVLQETPILRTMSRQFSGSNFIGARFRDHQRKIESVPKSPKSTESSSYASTFSSPLSNENGCQEADEEQVESFNTANQFYYSKFARAQVHHKFEHYFQWEPETLRTCAATVSDLRRQTLESIPQHEQDGRVEHMKTIYANCTKGVNKEMDALCCALFDLLDDVHEKRLSIHEEYVVAKYNKKMQGM